MSVVDYHQFWNEFNVYLSWLYVSFSVVCVGLCIRHTNVRWLLGSLALVQWLGMLATPWMREQGILYYLLISLFDVLIILLIFFRQSLCAFLSSPGFKSRFYTRWLSQLANSAEQTYRLTGIEYFIILVYLVSITVNSLSFLEALLRNVGVNSLIIWYLFPPLKLMTWCLTSLSAFIAVFHVKKGKEELLYQVSKPV
ncbi:hypothetical protein [Marinibactrum halimedae]|uniref:Uncharacterized protein n=1 Tax=Marinibactrum halimedae TaxID=1444977 RepID=A0AA37WPX0_9GAMM|nr:hypothetical protein [Marinibactrum halimedae]MCD9460808.1 hypothetical protein [Marinibactrum halimedae]GLS27396.1 hypothetical protein GCM10007877_31150 [Marinibactrum halimedae]